MYKFIVFSITFLLLVAIISPTLAESLWPADATAKDSPCADKRAVKVGDIVTIVIVESATSTSSASTDAKKESELEAGPGIGALLEKIPAFKYSGGDSVKASGATTRTSKFVAKITAKVIEVDKNGNLHIEGSKFVQTNKEKEEIKLTGIIRPEDVDTDNTVLSTSIADAKITHVGSGPIGSRQKEGIISKIFKILF